MFVSNITLFLSLFSFQYLHVMVVTPFVISYPTVLRPSIVLPSPSPSLFPSHFWRFLLRFFSRDSVLSHVPSTIKSPSKAFFISVTMFLSSGLSFCFPFCRISLFAFVAHLFLHALHLIHWRLWNVNPSSPEFYVRSFQYPCHISIWC